MSDVTGCRKTHVFITIIKWFIFLAPPSINLPPVAKIDVELGGSFTIICEAVGTPTPLIVWRLNWGNIPVGDRIHTSSSDGRGNLTITGARIEDSGAYTCEAINTKGSIFATPDAIIIVRSKYLQYVGIILWLVNLCVAYFFLRPNKVAWNRDDFFHLFNWFQLFFSENCFPNVARHGQNR